MIKPKSVEVYPVYICTSCHDRHVESVEYVKKVGKILCHCGQLLVLKKIKTFNIKPVYSEDVVKKIPSPPTSKKKAKIVTVTNKPKLEESDLQKNDEIYDGLEEALSDEKFKSESELKSLEYQTQIQTGVELLTSLGWKKTNATTDRVISLALKFEKQRGATVCEESSDDFMNFLIFNQ